MKMEEASRRYNIPLEVMKLYQSWGLCSTVKNIVGDMQYDDQDLERLSLMMTLHDCGFSSEEIERYMHLSIAGDSSKLERNKILEKHHEKMLDEIHFKEKQLSYIDFLRHKIRNNEPGGNDNGI